MATPLISDRAAPVAAALDWLSLALSAGQKNSATSLRHPNQSGPEHRYADLTRAGATAIHRRIVRPVHPDCEYDCRAIAGLPIGAKLF